MTSSVRGSSSTIKDFWKEGGTISFEFYYDEDFQGTLYDSEYRQDGTYIYNGTLSSGTMVFNYIFIIPAQEFDLDENNVAIDPGYFLRLPYELDDGDEVDYNFTVSGGILDFLVLNETQFNTWLGGTTSVQGIELLQTSIGASGTIDISNHDTYYFILWNNSENNNNPIILDLRFDFRISEKTETGNIEVDPVTLEDDEGVKTTDFGMDTSDWKIGKEIPLEIDEKDIYLSIVREEDFLISYNGESTDISCFVLEIKDYEQTIIEEETFSTKADIIFWKSKHSGVTLKSSVEVKYYNSNSSLIAITYGKYTVNAVENVELKSESGSFIVYPLIPIIVGIITLIYYKKKH